MTTAEKILRGILVAQETPGHWRDFSESYAMHASKYMPHQGRRECARRLKRMQTRSGQ